MRIGTIGAGKMAGALGGRFAEAGHEVMIGARNEERAATLADQIGFGARAGSLREAASFGDLVLVAVRRDGIEEAMNLAGGGERVLGGKTLIDCNNLGPDPADGPAIAHVIQDAAPDAYVVKAFNSCLFSVWSMKPPVFDGRPLAVPICGDNDASKAQVSSLVREIDCRPVDIGDLSKAKHLEYLAAIVVGLLFGGAHPTTVFNLVDARGWPTV